MKSYLVIFQFGPVKDFIQTARKTDDYWAGSFILSYAVGNAIVFFTKIGADIVFPDPEGNPLIKAVQNNNTFDSVDSLNPSLPNRLAFCISAETKIALKNTLNTVAQQLRDDLVSIFMDIEQLFSGILYGNSIAESQLNDMFEVYYAFTEIDSSNQGKIIDETEKRLAARKNIRDFKPFDQHSFKCTLCGVREPIRGKSAYLDDLKRDWFKIRVKEPFRFKPNERLCAICTGKRLLRKVHFKMGKIPSTTTVALSAWLADIVKKVQTSDAGLDFHANNLFLKYCALKIEDGVAVPRNMKDHNCLFKMEGEFFIDDAYDRMETELSEKVDTQKLADLRKQLKKFIEDLSLEAPPKYFTIISFDGDNMGDHRKKLQSNEAHKDFSKKLAGFTQKVYDLIHNTVYHGYVIYSGGDEGVILIPLSETLQVMDQLRKIFFSETGLTLSVGAAIVHHNAPLGEGLKAAEDALKRAKAVTNTANETSKNAFAFNLRKRSGAHMICSCPWEVEVKDEVKTKTDIIAFLLKWHDAYDQGMTRRWFYQVYKELPLFRKDPEQSLFGNTLYQILPRHIPDKKELGLSLAKETIDIVFSHDATSNIENLLSLLYIPIYIYEGGGN
jgi:CRISPR-associated protein Cmr2